MENTKLVKRSLLISGMLMMCIMAGCGKEKNVAMQNEAVKGSYESMDEELNIYISHTTECLREEKPELYKIMQTLLEDRAEVQFVLESPDIDLNGETVEIEDGTLYYPLKDNTLTVEGLVEQLLSVYEVGYIEKVLAPYYFVDAKYYLEQEGQLYGKDLAAVVTTLKEDWTLWQVNENYYYLQGYEDADVNTLVILTVVRETENSNFVISDEIEINLQ